MDRSRAQAIMNDLKDFAALRGRLEALVMIEEEERELTSEMRQQLKLMALALSSGLKAHAEVEGLLLASVFETPADTTPHPISPVEALRLAGYYEDKARGEND